MYQPLPLFNAADPAFRVLAFDHNVPTTEPLQISAWVAMSALQKGIRRGNVDLATRAAATLLKVDPGKLWRRLAGIAFEDVGLASIETVGLVMAGTAGKTVRQHFGGGEWAVASLLVKQMCQARKCRAADDLFLTIAHHHELKALRGDVTREDLRQHLTRVSERGALLGASLAALHGSGIRWNGQVAGKATDPKALFAAMRSAGIGHDIVALADQGFRRTREALPVLLPLLTLALPSGELQAQDDELPPFVIGHNGLPTYCLDMFSWEGKAALSLFLKSNATSARWLRKYIPASRRMAVLGGGLFRVEGGLVRQRIEWPAAQTLRSLADSGYHHLKLADPADLLQMIRADLLKLDEVRHDAH
ncbi:hypothetical protein [Mesorhizobium sp. Cs1321R2N1]|uniref:hypothetical protein n=1 Tax=Mesorhizobium sp. Cs1321R2N1 TaxID=3015174 RepID=UPI00301D607B